jgi:hypothetical protein
MKRLVSWVKSLRWVAWAVLAFAVVLVIWLVKGLFDGPKTGPGRLPEPPKKLKEKVEKAEEAALVSKVEARVEAEKAKEALDEIAEIDDGKERRKRLADMLNNL